MTAEHNHPPRCCCISASEQPALVNPGQSLPCPACPEHGELAPAIECPQCHQPIGRPHTEFCTLAPDRVWPEGHHLVHSEAFIDQGDPRSKAETAEDRSNRFWQGTALESVDTMLAAGDHPNDLGTGWHHTHADGQTWYHLEGQPCEEGNGLPDNEGPDSP